MYYVPSSLEPRNTILTEALFAFDSSGIHSGLSVKVSSYSPDVKCTFDSGHQDETACAKLIGTFLVGVSTFAFTRDKQTGQKSVIIPSGGKTITNGMHDGFPLPLLGIVESDFPLAAFGIDHFITNSARNVHRNHRFRGRRH